MDFKTSFSANDYSFGTTFGEIQEIGSGTNYYEKLENLPSINGATLIRGMKLQDIGIRPISNTELEEILK